MAIKFPEKHMEQLLRVCCSNGVYRSFSFTNLMACRSSRLQIFYKVSVLKKCSSGLLPTTLFKRDSNTGVLIVSFEIFTNTLFFASGIVSMEKMSNVCCHFTVYIRERVYSSGSSVKMLPLGVVLLVVRLYLFSTAL